MAKLEFKNKTLEKLFRNYKWARNNSIQMLDIAIANSIMDYSSKNNDFKFQPIKYQFQCLATTTDTYYRQLTNASNQDFGILVDNGKILDKKEIDSQVVHKQLNEQLLKLEDLFKSYTDNDFENNIKAIQAICNHEYLHQGQLLILFREAGVDVPERFKKAFAL